MKKLERKIIVIIAIVVVVLFGILKEKTGIFFEKDSDINQMASDSYKELPGDTEGDGQNANQKKQQLTENSNIDLDQGKQKVIEEHLRELSEYDNYKNKKLSWWIRRNDKHEISGCDDTINLSDCNAYYANLNAANTSGDKVMYLTFDCGYENGYTEIILDILKKHNVKACFFVTGTYIRDNVEIVKRMKEEGHYVGNHSWSHPTLPDISVEKQIDDMCKCKNYMKEATGYDMDPYCRPPKGEYSEKSLRLLNDLGYKTIFWSIVYLDYDVNKQPGKDYVIEHFKKFNHNGAIILMHNVSESNKDALDTVLGDMINEGYRFGSLDEL